MRTLASVALSLIAACAVAQTMPTDYGQVIDYLGKKGDFKDGVLKVNLPRSDIHFTIANIAVPTAFGFSGWLAMSKGSGHAMMMGDLVLLEDEVNPVLSALLDHGLEATALHNHFFFEHPRIFFMHVHGMGDPIDLAHRIKPALDLIGSGKQPEPDAKEISIDDSGVDKPMLDAIVGKQGDTLGKVYKYTIGRSDLKIAEMSAPINARMGLNTWAAFYGTEKEAIIAGDVAMLESEVPSVLQALRSHGLMVVSMHHHMIGLRPMIIFLHYWGHGPASKLAEGFRSALDQLGRSHGT